MMEMSKRRLPTIPTAAMGRVKKIMKLPSDRQERLPEGIFKHGPQDKSEHQRSPVVFILSHQVSQHSESQHDSYIDSAVVDTVGSDQAKE